jgi:hypothetical protein
MWCSYRWCHGQLLSRERQFAGSNGMTNQDYEDGGKHSEQYLELSVV